MRIQTGQFPNYKKFGSICEAIVLISITLILIGMYVSASGLSSVGPMWFVLLLVLIGLGTTGTVVASYQQIDQARRRAKRARFQINGQLIDTLIAEKVPKDVVLAMERMLNQDKVLVTGEGRFISRLESVLGKQRFREVGPIILKYTRV